MVAGKEIAGAVVALLTAACQPTLSFVAPPTSSANRRVKKSVCFCR